MINKSALMLMLLYLSACSYYSENNLSDFERMMSGFPICFIQGVYFEPSTQAQRNQYQYFLDRNLRPDSIDQDLASFYIDENYHGLKVYKIAIPVGYSSHVIYFQEPVARVKKQLEDIYYLGFYLSRPIEHAFGKAKPVLIADPNDNKRSILYCDTNYRS